MYNPDTFVLQLPLEDVLFHALRREAVTNGTDLKDLIKAILRGYVAQQHLPTLKGLTLPELAVMIQTGEISI
jgi:hypothetical protein